MTKVWCGPRMDCRGWLGVHRGDLLLIQKSRLIVQGQSITDDGPEMWVWQKGGPRGQVQPSKGQRPRPLA